MEFSEQDAQDNDIENISNQENLSKTSVQIMQMNYLDNQKDDETRQQEQQQQEQFQQYLNLDFQKLTLSNKENEILRKIKANSKLHTNGLDLLEQQCCKHNSGRNTSLAFNSLQQDSRYLKLYEDGYSKLDKQEKMIKLANSQAKLDCNQCIGDEKDMSFENLGRLLTVMDIFRILQYDEESNFINNEVLEPENHMNNKRKFEEMCLHEEIWSLLANDEAQEKIQANLVFLVFRILQDPARIAFEQRCNLIQDYLNKFKQVQSEKQKIKDLVQLWSQLNNDQLAFKKIGFLKPNKFQEYKEQQQQTLTFQPHINEVNYFLEQKNTTDFLKKHPIEGLENTMQQLQIQDQSQNQNSQQLSRSMSQQNKLMNFENRVKLLYKKKEVLNQKLENEKIKKQQEEILECRFQPDLSLNQKINDWALNQLKTTNNLLSGDDLVRGYKEQIGRIRVSIINKEKQKKSQENPTGEKYFENKNKTFKPPSFLNREKQQKKQPFYYIDVNIGNGKKGKIALYEGDDPKIIAHNFAKTFQLSEEMQDELYQMLRQQLEQYLKQKK